MYRPQSGLSCTGPRLSCSAVALDHELYVPYLREPASAFGKKTVKLWTTKATTTKVTATKKSLWRMYAADKTRELFD